MHYDKATRRLFFTTKLQDAVQCYSLENNQLMRSGTHHASAPVAFAFTSHLDILVSASARPALIFLTSMSGQFSPCTLRMDRSRSPAAAFSFLTPSSNIFAIAFVDGTVALYEIRVVSEQQAFHGTAPEVEVYELCYAKGVYSISASDIASMLDESRSGSSSGSDPKKAGRVSIAFVPGLQRILVTTGPDGICCVLNGQPVQSESKRMDLHKSWKVGAPTASIAILQPGLSSSCVVHEAADSTKMLEGPLIAIGRVDGIVSFFDLDGHRLAEAGLSHICPVVDLEWAPTARDHEASDGAVAKAHPANDILRVPEAAFSPVSSSGRSVYYSPLKFDIGTKIKPNVTRSKSLDKPPLRRPAIPVRTRSKPSHSTSSIRRRRARFSSEKRGLETLLPKPSIHPAGNPNILHSDQEPVEQNGFVPEKIKLAAHANDITLPQGRGHRQYTTMSEQVLPPKIRQESSFKDEEKKLDPQPQVEVTSVSHSKVQRAKPIPLSDNEANPVSNGLDMREQDACDATAPARHGSRLRRWVDRKKDLELKKGGQHFEFTHSSSSSSQHSHFFPHRPKTPILRRTVNLSKYHTKQQMSKDNHDQPLPPPLPPRPQHLTKGISALQPTPSTLIDLQRSTPPKKEFPKATPAAKSAPEEQIIEDMRTLLREEISFLRHELNTQFNHQSEWFEHLLQDERGRQLIMLEQRNRILKLELYRMKDKPVNQTKKEKTRV